MAKKRRPISGDDLLSNSLPPTEEETTNDTPEPAAEALPQEKGTGYRRVQGGYVRESGQKVGRVSLYLPPEQIRQLKTDAIMRGYSGPAEYVAAMCGLDRPQGMQPPPLPG